MIRIAHLIPAIVLLSMVYQPVSAGYCLCKPGRTNSKCLYPDDYEYVCE